MSVSKKEILTMHAAALANAKAMKEADPLLSAFNETRTEVHAALQAQKPAPLAAEGEGKEVLNAKQKEWGIALWVETDKLVKDAGVSEKGVS